MGAKEEEIVSKFVGAFADGWPEDLDAPLSLMADNGYYQMNTPTREPLYGHAAIKAEWEKQRDYHCTHVRAEVKAMASNDRFVFQERVDHGEINGKWVHAPLVAVFEVEDGKIVAWREYFDSPGVAAQFGISPEEYYELDEGSTFGQKTPA